MDAPKDPKETQKNGTAGDSASNITNKNSNNQPANAKSNTNPDQDAARVPNPDQSEARVTNANSDNNTTATNPIPAPSANAANTNEPLADQIVDSLDSLQEQFKPGAIVEANVTLELKRAYLDYAMSVIAARALPDVRDGLKPSQRRILVAMKDLNLMPNSSFRKSAKIVGETMGNYHPHGDAATYMTLVHMAQDFSMRYPLVHGQGNFGSIDGDPPAQQRYTEAKLRKIATEMLSLLDKGVVEFMPNYDGSRLEPTVLPALFPNLFANGAEGIAVGMATKIPPHNLGELIDALIFVIDNGNTFKGKSLFNLLRELRQKRHKLPQTLPEHPTSLLDFYFEQDLLNNKTFRQAIEKLVYEGILDIKPIQEALGQEQTQKLLEFLGIDPTTATAGTIKIDPNKFTLYPKFKTNATLDQLMQYIKGPDFPTYGEIYNPETIKEIYATGKGKVTLRGVAKIEEKRGKYSIIITELPYQVNKASLVEHIAKLVQAGKLKHIKDIRDESGKEGIRVVIELKKDANPYILLNKLYKLTPLQINYHANMIALVGKQPITLTLKKYLELYLEFRLQLAIRALEFELAQTQYRAHILEGLLKALDFIDEVIKIIRSSKTQDEAKQRLMERFDLTHLQAQAILDMPLKRLVALEREKIQEEYDKLQAIIKHHTEHLTSQPKLLELVKQDLLRIKETYADKRRTRIKGKLKQLKDEDLVADEQVLVTITAKGFVKRTPVKSYQAQRARGVGAKSITFKDDDSIVDSVIASTKDTILIFTDDGKVYSLVVYEIPEFKGKSRGVHLSSLTGISPSQKVVRVLRQQALESGYLLFVTKNGMVKKTPIAAYKNLNKTGLIAIKLKKDDMLKDVIYLPKDMHVLIVTAKGNSIRIDTSEVRETGRATAGVKGISFKTGQDYVIAIEPITSDQDYILTVSAKGYGKFTRVSEFKVQHRGGKGIRAAKVTGKTGDLVQVRVVGADGHDVDAEQNKSAGSAATAQGTSTTTNQGANQGQTQQAQLQIEGDVVAVTGGQGEQRSKAAAANAKTASQDAQEHVVIITKQGRIIKISKDALPVLSRQSQGNRLIKVKSDDIVVGVQVV